MKKVFLFSIMSLMALAFCTLVGCTKDKNEASGNGGFAGTNNGVATGEYVDLGLRSGTKWKATNEVNEAEAEYDFFTYDEAMDSFGNSLPTKEQWDELVAECQWSWTGSGCNFTGPKGNSITLPAAGFRLCDGGVDGVGSNGFYWSSTPGDSEEVWCLDLESGGVDMYRNGRCGGSSVRLVQD